jgi:hypothetical protein
MPTSRQINSALKKQGYNVEIVKGKDYCYFSGRDATMLRQTTVYVPRLKDLTIEQWVGEFEYLAITGK